MASKFFVPAAACEPRSSAIVEELDATRRRLVVRFGGAAGSNAYYTVIIPQDTDLSGDPSIVLYWLSAGTANAVEWEVEVESVTPGDSLDIDANDSFDATNAAAGATVPGTAGFVTTTTVALTNRDSMAAGDIVRLRISRDGTNDSNNDNAYLLSFEFRDVA
jgi:hypothetical protein